MSSTVTVRNVTFGEGRPKLCVPLTDPDPAGLESSLLLVKSAPFDLVEWRADFYRDVADPQARAEAMALLRRELGDVPVLLTVRTSREGGRMDMDTGAYTKLLLSAMESGLADMVDVELSRGGAAVEAVVEAARNSGVKVVVSRHDFTATPGKSVIVNSLCRMQELGADIVKFAVTPRCPRDVLTLLDATLTMKEEHGDTPVVTMSMGSAGAVSRVCGGLFGSCMSFGAVGRASAPGQLPAAVLSSFLENLS